MPVIPGVATATEIIAALDHGCELLKFFPAEASGGIGDDQRAARRHSPTFASSRPAA